MEKIRIALADDHQLFRNGLKILLGIVHVAGPGTVAFAAVCPAQGCRSGMRTKRKKPVVSDV